MAEAAEIISEIEALTVHCRPPVMSVEQRARWQMDWADDLAGFNIDLIRRALRDWRQGENAKFPTPGQIKPMLERLSGVGRMSKEDALAWSYEIADDEYRALSLNGKIRHHRIAANYCRRKAGPMPHLGKPVRREDMPREWQDWQSRAASHDAEANRLHHSTGRLDQRA